MWRRAWIFYFYHFSWLAEFNLGVWTILSLSLVQLQSRTVDTFSTVLEWKMDCKYIFYLVLKRNKIFFDKENTESSLNFKITLVCIWRNPVLYVAYVNVKHWIAAWIVLIVLNTWICDMCVTFAKFGCFYFVTIIISNAVFDRFTKELARYFNWAVY